MIEKVFKYSLEDEKKIEKLVDDNNVMLNHMVLNKGEFLPKHYSNSNVYMIIVRGSMSIDLENQGINKHCKGEILNIPYNVHMDVRNEDDEVLEFFVVKAPNPKNYKED